MLAATRSFGIIVAKDLLRNTRVPLDPSQHLKAGAEWLERAHDATPDGGVSYGYCLRGSGWRPSYRETTGYILETFFDLDKRKFRAGAKDRAVIMARWLMEVQNPDGSIANPQFHPHKGIVFDTGQVLFGLVRAFEETQDATLLRAAERAGEWLVNVADDRGRWTRSTYLEVPHVYNTRTAWALLRLNQISKKNAGERERVARANLDFALAQERSGGYELCAFEPWNPPFTHTIAYALRGLVESSQLLKDDRYLESAIRVAKSIQTHVRSDGFIPGEIDPAGKPRATYCCLTGNCQLGIVWAKLFRLSGDTEFKNAATAAVRYVLGWQDIATTDPNVRGGIKGSQPVWGRYAPFSLPNWATKFFVEALLLFPEWIS